MANGIRLVKDRKTKKREKKSKNKTDSQAPHQFSAGHHVQRRFEIPERLCEAIVIICGLLTALGGNHILFIGIGVCAAVLAFCFWFADRESNREIDLSSPSPTPEPVSTPTLTPVVTTPTPQENVLVKPSELTALQIMDRIKSASTYNRDEVAAAFIAHPIDEIMFFKSASRIGTEKESMLVFLGFGDDKEHLFESVICDVPTKGHERLPAMEETDRFRVKGIIERASQYDIRLKDASVEQVKE